MTPKRNRDEMLGVDGIAFWIKLKMLGLLFEAEGLLFLFLVLVEGLFASSFSFSELSPWRMIGVFASFSDAKIDNSGFMRTMKSLIKKSNIFFDKKK